MSSVLKISHRKIFLLMDLRGELLRDEVSLVVKRIVGAAREGSLAGLDEKVHDLPNLR
jgi:hypothetical protein